ncbi:MAG TPA: GNAT family protein [Bacillales bacterium]|nr:GNAT family protein [Bacillales bacterium]
MRFTYRLDGETYLKLLDLEDTKDVFELVDSDREHLKHWLPWIDGTRSVADSRVFIESTKKQFAEGNGFQVGIWYKGELAGVSGFHKIDWDHRKTGIGYWLGEPFEGLGLMTKTCRALIDHAFQVWELNRVEIRCGTENTKSCAIPERLGFTREGTIREAELVNGYAISHHVYGVLKSEWEREHHHVRD